MTPGQAPYPIVMCKIFNVKVPSLKKYYLIIILVVNQGCTSEVSDDNTVSIQILDTTPHGIYEGTVTRKDGEISSAVAYITPDNILSVINTSTLESAIGYIFNITPSLNDYSFAGTYYQPPVNLSLRGSLSITFEFSGNKEISGSYVGIAPGSIVSEDFNFKINQDLKNRTSLLSKIEGVWVDVDFINVAGVTTWVIQSDGAFTLSSTSGCTADGLFTITDTSINQYNLTMLMSNCASFNGSNSGYAYLSDTFDRDDTISLVFGNSSKTRFSKPIKQ